MRPYIKALLVGRGWDRYTNSEHNFIKEGATIFAEVASIKVGDITYVMSGSEETRQDIEVVGKGLDMANPEPRAENQQIALTEVQERVTLRDIFGAMPKEMTVIFPEEK